MPPVSKAGGSAFRKDVAFAETKESDEYELEAAGIVMVPDKADLQNDFAREDTIRSFTEQFETFEEAGQAGGGIMHAVWPDGWMDLTRNEVLDESEEIGGRTVDSGAWVQRWGINNAELAELVDDNILEGYSIGAIQVDWDGPYEQDEVADVDTSEIPDDELVWELTDGIIREVSAVDIPAVPDAQILEAKNLEKRLSDHLGNADAFLEEAMERGHSEDEAQRLWDVLNEAMEADGASEPGKQSVLARAGKAFLGALTGSDDGADEKTSPEALDDGPNASDLDDPGHIPGRSKEGRTLSKQNRESLFATIDASLDVLEDAGVDHGMTRFTDREEWAFDLSEHSGREWQTDDDDDGEEDDEESEDSTINNDAGGDTPDDNTDMSDDNPDDPGEDKSLAEQNAEQINELTQAVESLTETLTGPEAKTAEIEIDGETYEVREDAAKAALGVDGDDDVADAIERLNEKAERVDDVEQRLDTISQQSGVSTQIEAAADEGEGDDDSGLEGLGKALS